MAINRLLTILLLSSSLSVFASNPTGKRFEQQTYFENTPYELNVYRINGRIPDKTMLVIGGIQGDEPTSYLAADHYVDINLEHGTLIMVPRANFNTIIQDLREFNGDMNRKFTTQKREANYEEKIVEILKSLISEADVLLNLHEGSGYYRDTWLSKIKNPMRYGQSIIADTDVFYNSDSTQVLHLEEIAKQVIQRVNERIEDPEQHFYFNNHNTFSLHTKHAEQRKSATYFALSNFGIPAFGVESSKDIQDIETKVRHQVWIINEFMRIFNIIPEIPRIYLEYPELKFVIVTINESHSITVPKNKTLYVNKGDLIEINHIEANYERGLSIDILNYGTLNDINTKFRVNQSTKAVIRKDKFFCGEITLAVRDNETTEQIYNYLVLDVNSNIEIVEQNSPLELVKGDIVKIIDTVPSSKSDASIRLNFYGFVPENTKNTADDRYHAINTSRDLLDQYSQEGDGSAYNIRIEKFNEILGQFKIVLKTPQLFSLTLESDNKKYKVTRNETIQFNKSQTIKIVDVETNIHDKESLIVNFKGFVGRKSGEDRSLEILLDKNLLKQYSLDKKGITYPITVSKNSQEVGKIFISIIN